MGRNPPHSGIIDAELLTEFRDLLDEVRFGLAREYLGSTELPIEEISRMLGYTESGNFSHAFRRWSGVSPSGWRREYSPHLAM